MKWFVKCIKNYANFKGRARRAEYWYFVLFVILITIALSILDITLFGLDKRIFTPLFSLFIFIPNLAVMVRRLHDTNRSGKIVMWYYIACFVWVIALIVSGFSSIVSLLSGSLQSMPIGFMIILIAGLIGFLIWGILFLVWFCTAGTEGDNQYGPDPKAVEE